MSSAENFTQSDERQITIPSDSWVNSVYTSREFGC